MSASIAMGRTRRMAAASAAGVKASLRLSTRPWSTGCSGSAADHGPLRLVQLLEEIRILPRDGVPAEALQPFIRWMLRPASKASSIDGG